ncbi:MAG: hypothetical protein NTW25_01875 [Candidatus Kapabacteria bacterium]|nr:hypothetical protein [Candidatus Kapabacteria bacterium]
MKYKYIIKFIKFTLKSIIFLLIFLFIVSLIRDYYFKSMLGKADIFYNKNRNEIQKINLNRLNNNILHIYLSRNSSYISIIDTVSNSNLDSLKEITYFFDISNDFINIQISKDFYLDNELNEFFQKVLKLRKNNNDLSIVNYYKKNYNDLINDRFIVLGLNGTKVCYYQNGYKKIPNKISGDEIVYKYTNKLDSFAFSTILVWF